MGIEPTYPAWKAGVLPLNYTRMINYEIVMPRTGIEPVTRGFSVLCSTNWAIWASWGILWFSCSLLFSDMSYYTRESFKCQLFFSTFLNFFKNFFNLLFLPHSQRPHLYLQIFRKQWKNRLFFIFLHLFDFDGWQILLGVFIMHVTKNTDKPMRKRSIWPMYRHREFRMVETERLTVSEWTSEGSLERLFQ